MGQQIIQQPNGEYAIFSSVVDDFIVLNATPEEIIDYWVGCERERLTRFVRRVVDELSEGKKPYFQFQMTWNEAHELIERVHRRTAKPAEIKTGGK